MNPVSQRCLQPGCDGVFELTWLADGVNELACTVCGYIGQSSAIVGVEGPERDIFAEYNDDGTWDNTQMRGWTHIATDTKQDNDRKERFAQRLTEIYDEVGRLTLSLHMNEAQNLTAVKYLKELTSRKTKLYVFIISSSWRGDASSKVVASSCVALTAFKLRLGITAKDICEKSGSSPRMVGKLITQMRSEDLSTNEAKGATFLAELEGEFATTLREEPLRSLLGAEQGRDASYDEVLERLEGKSEKVSEAKLAEIAAVAIRIVEVMLTVDPPPFNAGLVHFPLWNEAAAGLYLAATHADPIWKHHRLSQRLRTTLRKMFLAKTAQALVVDGREEGGKTAGRRDAVPRAVNALRALSRTTSSTAFLTTGGNFEAFGHMAHCINNIPALLRRYRTVQESIEKKAGGGGGGGGGGVGGGGGGAVTTKRQNGTDRAQPRTLKRKRGEEKEG